MGQVIEMERYLQTIRDCERYKIESMHLKARLHVLEYALKRISEQSEEAINNDENLYYWLSVCHRIAKDALKIK